MKTRSRKARTRIRRPKYLSLRLQLSPDNTETPSTTTIPEDNMKLIDLIRLNRTTTITSSTLLPIEVEKLDHDHSNMAARLFTNCTAAAATLTDILAEDESRRREEGAGSMHRRKEVAEVEEERGSAVSTSCWASRSSSAATSAGSRRGSLLEKAALRSSVRREEEEEAEEMKWVRMSEVVTEEEERMNKRDQEEVSSCVDHRKGEVGLSGGWWWPERNKEESGGGGGGGMLLKLNYGDVINAWGDIGGGGPFCWDFEDQDSPQTVPDLQPPQHQSVQSISAGAAWTVPVHDQQQMKTTISADQINGELLTEPAGTQLDTRALREASILRYKEKRMNRLFSKRIRYEVRKLNAEKRPRIKGRFVKRD